MHTDTQRDEERKKYFSKMTEIHNGLKKTVNRKTRER